MKKILAAITVAAALIGSGASAFDAGDLNKLKELMELKSNPGVGLDLLSGALTLEEKNEHRKLKNEYGEKLENIRKAIQIGADLKAANLRGTDLSGETLKAANLTDANLKGANLKGANLIGSDLTDADLSGSDLTDADLSGSDLTDADLRGAIMNGAILCNTTMPSGEVIYSGC